MKPKTTFNMTQHLLKNSFLRGVLFLLLCVVGIGNAWGEEVTVTFDASNQGYTNEQDINNVTITDGITVTFDKGTNNNTCKYYTTGTAIRVYGGGYFTIASTIGKIIKIQLTFGSGDGSNEITKDSGTYYSSTGTWEGSSESITFTIGGTTGHRKIKTIAVTYEKDANAPIIESLAISGTASNTTYYVGDTPSAEGLGVIATYNDESTKDVTSSVSWSFEPATIQSNTNSVTATASYEGITVSTTYNITVKSIANTAENAYTVAQAYSIINAGRGLAEEVYVKGIVAQVDNITDGHLTYCISDDGMTSKTFQCLQGLDIGAKEFESNADLAIGSRVVVKGLLQKVNGVCGFKENNILNESKALASIVIEGNATKTSYFVDENPDASGLTVIAKYSDESSFDVTRSATWSFLPQTISKNTTEVQAVASYLNKTANCSFPISVKEVVYDLIPLKGETAVYDSPNPTGIYIEGVTWFVKGVSDEVPWKIGGKEIEEATDRSIYCSTPVYGTIDEVIVSVGGSSGGIDFHKLSLIVTDKNKNTIGTLSLPSPQPNNEYAFDLTNLSKKATDCCYKIVYNISVVGKSNKYIEFCRAKFVGTPAQYLIPVEQEYATLCLPYNVAVPEGVVAYSASENGEYIRLTPIPGNIIAANEGVVLKAPSGEYPFTSTNKQATRNADNLMIGVTKDTPLTASDKAYMLTRKKEDGSIAFRLLNTDYTLGANKAYLKLPDGNNARDVISVQWDDCETGIIEPLSKGKDNEIVIYNLSGQKMKQTQKGINIINGKLVVR